MILELFVVAFLLLGVILTAIPTVPGMGFMFVVVLIYSVIDKFETYSPWWLLLFAGLVLLGIVTDYLSGIIGAKFGGANKYSLLLGFVGLVIGFFVFPPLGLFIGLFLGIFIGELVQVQDHTQALKAAGYGFIGALAGMGVNILIAVAFLVSYVVLVF